MKRPTITIHNQENDEIVTREMNDQEFADYQKLNADWLAEKEKRDAAEAAKASAIEKLAALGLSVDEVSALLK
jgi:DNA-binding transcriptional regulator YhcF (GntR family)